MDKIVVIGAVASTEALLLKLIEYEFNISCVFGYEPQDTKNVSGYVSFKDICNKYNIRFIPFVNINESENITILSEVKPDIIFAVGFSQLLSKSILELPKKGVIGFHPTLLPKGRGRAPIAWLILKERFGAANFFSMREGADDGPLFVQHKFIIEENDDATSVGNKIIAAINSALDEWLPKLKGDEWNPIEQNHREATEYGRRAPLDGIVNWYNSATNIDKLIKASAKPHPGAFTFYEDYRIIIWKSAIESNIKITGVVGRVVKIEDNNLLVQTGEGLLWVYEYQATDFEGNMVKPALMVGSRFGYYEQNEIYKLRNELKILKSKFDEFTGNK